MNLQGPKSQLPVQKSLDSDPHYFHPGLHLQARLQRRYLPPPRSADPRLSADPHRSSDRPGSPVLHPDFQQRIHPDLRRPHNSQSPRRHRDLHSPQSPQDPRPLHSSLCPQDLRHPQSLQNIRHLHSLQDFRHLHSLQDSRLQGQHPLHPSAQAYRWRDRPAHLRYFPDQKWKHPRRQLHCPPPSAPQTAPQTVPLRTDPPVPMPRSGHSPTSLCRIPGSRKHWRRQVPHSRTGLPPLRRLHCPQHPPRPHRLYHHRLHYRKCHLQRLHPQSLLRPYLLRWRPHFPQTPDQHHRCFPPWCLRQGHFWRPLQKRRATNMPNSVSRWPASLSKALRIPVSSVLSWQTSCCKIKQHYVTPWTCNRPDSLSVQVEKFRKND